MRTLRPALPDLGTPPIDRLRRTCHSFSALALLLVPDISDMVASGAQSGISAIAAKEGEGRETDTDG